MPNMRLNEQVTVGGQPTAEELKALGEEGFKSVVNFRTADEGQELSPVDEAKVVEAAGMQYLHIPVSMQTMGPDLVDQFRAAFPDLPKPMFAHCEKGKRAGAVVMMHMACEQGMTGDQTLAQAEKMGFECDQPELKLFVKSYVDQNTQGS